MKEQKKRSIVKAISWRTFATLDTLVLVFLFTGRFTLAIKVGGFEILTKMILYFFHERLWNRISWGRK